MKRRFAAADPVGKSKYRAQFEDKAVPKLPKRRSAGGRSRGRGRTR
jgi:hypothetical protein